MNRYRHEWRVTLKCSAYLGFVHRPCLPIFSWVQACCPQKKGASIGVLARGER